MHEVWANKNTGIETRTCCINQSNRRLINYMNMALKLCYKLNMSRTIILAAIAKLQHHSIVKINLAVNIWMCLVIDETNRFSLHFCTRNMAMTMFEHVERCPWHIEISSYTIMTLDVKKVHWQQEKFPIKVLAQNARHCRLSIYRSRKYTYKLKEKVNSSMLICIPSF